MSAGEPKGLERDRSSAMMRSLNALSAAEPLDGIVEAPASGAAASEDYSDNEILEPSPALLKRADTEQVCEFKKLASVENTSVAPQNARANRMCFGGALMG